MIILNFVVGLKSPVEIISVVKVS